MVLDGAYQICVWENIKIRTHITLIVSEVSQSILCLFCVKVILISRCSVYAVSHSNKHTLTDIHTDTWGHCSVCGLAGFSTTGYTMLSTDKQIVQDCKQTAHIWTNSLLWRSFFFPCVSHCGEFRHGLSFCGLWDFNFPKWPNHRDTDFYSGFNLAWSKQQMEDLDLDSTGVNWFPLAYTHIASGPSASSSRGMRGLPF